MLTNTRTRQLRPYPKVSTRMKKVTTTMVGGSLHIGRRYGLVTSLRRKDRARLRFTWTRSPITPSGDEGAEGAFSCSGSRTWDGARCRELVVDNACLSALVVLRASLPSKIRISGVLLVKQMERSIKADTTAQALVIFPD